MTAVVCRLASDARQRQSIGLTTVWFCDCCLLLLLPCVLCLRYEVLPLVDRVLLDLFVMCLLQGAAVGDTVEHASEESGVPDNLE